jgi:hypothetical protein
VQLPSDTKRKPVASNRDVLLPLESYLLFVPRVSRFAKCEYGEEVIAVSLSVPTFIYIFVLDLSV